MSAQVTLRHNAIEGGDLPNDQASRDKLLHLAGQAGTILADAFLMFGRLNFLTGDFEIIKRDPVIPATGAGYKGNVQAYTQMLLDQKLIHPDYVSEFKTRTDIGRMRRFAFSGERIRSFVVRTNNPTGIEWMCFCFAAGRDCSPENPWGALFIMPESVDGLPASAQKRFYETDALTGLFSRGKFKSDVAELQVADCDGIACVYVDAVGLHELNNHLGHAKGDEMLKNIGNVLTSSFEDGFVYRIGGDEFVVLVPNMGKDEAAHQVSVAKQGLRDLDIYISVGVSCVADAALLPTAIEAAERLMRDDKQNFYESDEEGRHLRVLNERLESILQEKQDTERYLHTLVPERTCAYVVDMQKDTGRCVTAPEAVRQFQHRGADGFSSAVEFYIKDSMAPSQQKVIRQLTDYDFVRSELYAGHTIERHLQCLDGRGYSLRISPYSGERRDRNLCIWTLSPIQQSTPEAQ